MCVDSPAKVIGHVVTKYKAVQEAQGKVVVCPAALENDVAFLVYTADFLDVAGAVLDLLVVTVFGDARDGSGREVGIEDASLTHVI